MDRQTNGPTDKADCRVSCTRLKMPFLRHFTAFYGVFSFIYLWTSEKLKTLQAENGREFKNTQAEFKKAVSYTMYDVYHSKATWYSFNLKSHFRTIWKIAKIYSMITMQYLISNGMIGIHLPVVFSFSKMIFLLYRRSLRPNFAGVVIWSFAT